MAFIGLYAFEYSSTHSKGNILLPLIGILGSFQLEWQMIYRR